MDAYTSRTLKNRVRAGTNEDQIDAIEEQEM